MHRILVIGLFVSLTFLGCKEKKQQEIETAREKPKPVQQDSVIAQNFDMYGFATDGVSVEDHTVQRNESLYLILDKFDFNPQEIHTVTQKAEEVVDVSRLRPGQIYRTYASADSSSSAINQMVWQPNPVDYVVFDWERDSVEIYKASRILTNEAAVTAGEINGSLFETISQQKASSLLGHKLSEIFAWQIDFFGLREGDGFKALYNKRYIEDDFYGIGDVMAAEFLHRGDSYRAYRFKRGDIDGYFNEKGESVQKALLKAPFKFNQRISSHFSNSRLHPILKKRMPHYGVDYAAPTGTPVLAVGDGVVTEAQYRGANGNIIKIKHNSKYRTAYLHLQGFAKGIYQGAKVKQGQIIGYVGSTGRSTGPHLDYRLYKNGRPVNPVTIELPSSEAVPEELMAEFKEVRDALDEQMDRLEQSPETDSQESILLTQNQAR